MVPTGSRQVRGATKRPCVCVCECMCFCMRRKSAEERKQYDSIHLCISHALYIGAQTKVLLSTWFYIFIILLLAWRFISLALHALASSFPSIFHFFSSCVYIWFRSSHLFYITTENLYATSSKLKNLNETPPRTLTSSRERTTNSVVTCNTHAINGNPSHGKYFKHIWHWWFVSFAFDTHIQITWTEKKCRIESEVEEEEEAKKNTKWALNIHVLYIDIFYANETINLEYQIRGILYSFLLYCVTRVRMCTFRSLFKRSASNS